jgi:hypothetical protein
MPVVSDLYVREIGDALLGPPECTACCKRDCRKINHCKKGGIHDYSAVVACLSCSALG